MFSLTAYIYENGEVNHCFIDSCILPSGQTIKIEFEEYILNDKIYYNVYLVTMDKRKNEFKTKLKEMPTEYFESKYLGKLELSNFKLAIIPKNASKETKEILAKNGIKYKTYDPKLPDSRIEVIKREAEKKL